MGYSKYEVEERLKICTEIIRLAKEIADLLGDRDIRFVTREQQEYNIERYTDEAD